MCCQFSAGEAATLLYWDTVADLKELMQHIRVEETVEKLKSLKPLILSISYTKDPDAVCLPLLSDYKVSATY